MPHMLVAFAMSSDSQEQQREAEQQNYRYHKHEVSGPSLERLWTYQARRSSVKTTSGPDTSHGIGRYGLISSQKEL